MKKNNEIKTTDTIKCIGFDNLKKGIDVLTNGIDYLPDEEANLTNIPNRINHSTYGISQLIKPFTIAADQSSPTAANYLFEITDSIRSLDAGMLARDEKYALIKILHPAFTMIHNKLNKALVKHNIKCNKLHELYEEDMNRVTENAYRAMTAAFNPDTLSNIEQMMALYLSFNENKDDKSFYATVPYTLVSPFVNEATMKILYDLYNYAVGLLAKVTIHDSIHTGTLHLLDDFEAELEDTFITIHDDLINELAYVAAEWVLCRTPQNNLPEFRD